MDFLVCRSAFYFDSCFFFFKVMAFLDTYLENMYIEMFGWKALVHLFYIPIRF